MFKRRKPDEIASDSQQGSAPVPQPAQPTSTTRNKYGELGVPPFRPPPPAPAGIATAGIATAQETQMGRAPFPAPPSPNAQPAPRPGAAIQQNGPTQNPQFHSPQTQGQVGLHYAPGEKRTLVVGRGISVQGTVQDAERLVVEGTVEAGMIHATELHIAPSGVFRGEAQVTDVELAGTIDGTLIAHGNLIIRSTGRLLGTAKCRRLQVEDGGQVSGRLEMLTDAPAIPGVQVSSAQVSETQANPSIEPVRPAPHVPEAVPPRPDGIPASSL